MGEEESQRPGEDFMQVGRALEQARELRTRDVASWMPQLLESPDLKGMCREITDDPAMYPFVYRLGGPLMDVFDLMHFPDERPAFLPLFVQPGAPSSNVAPASLIEVTNYDPHRTGKFIDFVGKPGSGIKLLGIAVDTDRPAGECTMAFCEITGRMPETPAGKDATAGLPFMSARALTPAELNGIELRPSRVVHAVSHLRNWK